MAAEQFPERGLVYFWFLNDECDTAHIEWQIAQFAAVGAAAVVLHPRAGLLLPYGGDDWFAFIAQVVDRCAAAGLPVWLYDEDPYPSGNAGGWLTVERSEFRARAIERHVAPATAAAGELFCFPTGNLLWAGLVDPAGALPPVDLTARVGIVRREWRELLDWDSRWYYPATPLYKCDRADTYTPEFALRLPALPAGLTPMAFVARPVGADSVWGALHDSLNPAATEAFLHATHDRYRRTLGHRFGKEITAIFTDEPKYFGCRPWTPGLERAFAADFGYDLRPRLNDLFSDDASPRAMTTRVHYREWCGRRFEAAWLRPVAAWCHTHKLRLVGHISPEDDPVEQANTISNLFPLQRHFDLAGLDLIVPAVGDDRHPLLNLGCTVGASVAQQHDKPGVMSESLGCSGLEMTADAAVRILRWQLTMGVTTPVVHGAFSSVAGQRLIDAPPDFGPASSRWAGLNAARDEFRAVQAVTIGAEQVAPVAILWPIRGFQAETIAWQGEPGGRRGALAELLLRCLQAQVGVHLMDEADLITAPETAGALRLGRARYTHVIVPPCRLLRAATLARLQALHEGGAVCVRFTDELPAWAQDEHAVGPVTVAWATPVTTAEVVAQLPPLADIAAADRTQLRVTAWRRGAATTALAMNLGDATLAVTINGQPHELQPGELRRIAL